MSNNQPLIWQFVDGHSEAFKRLADEVWATPETCYMETASAAAHTAELTRQGFRVQTGIAGIDTAVMGEAGEGGPVIAILGEYDALPGLSQEAGVAEHRPVAAGGNGHGCGHNLLGAGAMLVATALKDWLAQTGTPGRVRYYGCPAEEGGAAKAFMVRDGLFDDVDIAFCWHPNAIAEVLPADTLANTRIDFTFHGISAHASGAPQLGRSALDAMELTSVGANYLREHMPSDARIHYAILDGGGIAPNVVQARAKMRYSVRARTVAEMVALVERMRDVARGAALMTGTRVEDQVISAVSDLVPCHPLNDLVRRQLELVGAPVFTEADRAFAREIRKTFPRSDVESVYARYDYEADLDAELGDFLMPADAFRRNGMGMGSTDVSDVSWVVPTAQLHGANYAIGTPFHSWQMVAQGKSPAAHTGMIHVARVLSGAAVELFGNPGLIAECKKDHQRRAGRERYVSPLPEGTVPPVKEMRQ